MYRVLWTMVVLAALALGSSIASAVINHSEVSTQSGKLAVLARQEAGDRKEITALRNELRARSVAQPSPPAESAVGVPVLFYSGLPWRDAPSANW